MNSIYQRSIPAIRFKIQGIHLCEKLNKHISWKRKADVLMYIILKILESNYKVEKKYQIKHDQGLRITAII